MVVRPTPVSRLSICTKVGRINGAAADGRLGPGSSMLVNREASLRRWVILFTVCGSAG